MPVACLSSKGQITIPKEIRDALRLKTGDRIAFRFRRNGAVELVPETEDILSLRGIIKPKIRGITLEDMDEAIAKEAGRS
jgi:antitoxin PrlF